MDTWTDRDSDIWTSRAESCFFAAKSMTLSIQHSIPSISKEKKYFSHACSIQEDDRVIITGGHSATTVSVYDENGWKEDMPNLKLGRSAHACTSFVSGGKKVCLMYLMCI